MLVLRPADGAETTVAWKIALEENEGPSALCSPARISRTFPRCPGQHRFNDALAAGNGAYIVIDCEGTPDCILAANGSEVATLVECAKILSNEKDLKIRVVSAPSEGLFREQAPEYQDSVLPVRCSRRWGLPRVFR